MKTRKSLLGFFAAIFFIALCWLPGAYGAACPPGGINEDAYLGPLATPVRGLDTFSGVLSVDIEIVDVPNSSLPLPPSPYSEADDSQGTDYLVKMKFNLSLFQEGQGNNPPTMQNFSAVASYYDLNTDQEYYLFWLIGDTCGGTFTEAFNKFMCGVVSDGLGGNAELIDASNLMGNIEDQFENRINGGSFQPNDPLKAYWNVTIQVNPGSSNYCSP